MRELIIKRIEEIKNRENNFPKTSMRWKNFTCGDNNIHISIYNFETCPDDELIIIFERLIKKHYAFM